MKDRYKVTGVKGNKIFLTRLPNLFEQSVGFIVLFFLFGWLFYLFLIVTAYIVYFVSVPLVFLYKLSPKLSWLVITICIVSGLYFTFSSEIHDAYHYRLGMYAIDVGRWQDGINHLDAIKELSYSGRRKLLLKAYENLFIEAMNQNDTEKIALYALKVDIYGKLSDDYKKIIRENNDLLNAIIDFSDLGEAGAFNLIYEDQEAMISNNIAIMPNKISNNNCGGTIYHFVIENTGLKPRKLYLVAHSGNGKLSRSNTPHSECYDIDEDQTFEDIVFTLNPGDKYSVAYRYIPEYLGEHRKISIFSRNLYFSWTLQ